ncbi:MAG: 4Fe-4S ferredoxin [Desulfohalobiaceae bacterium]|nr:4Fe-4S ferredoxin [Desulfohalobiaceae bacterium]
MSRKETAQWIEEEVRAFVSSSRENSLRSGRPEPAFAEPLLGIARGDDPLFQDFKDHVGEFHWTPVEAFGLAFPGEEIRGEDLSVISWVLPQTSQTKDDNRRQTRYPAERWARARIYGERFNVALREHVVRTLSKEGHQALAPMLLSQWQWRDSTRYGFASTWSERHAAFAAGLGTFGLCAGLITPAGKAMRLGSVIARLRLEPSPRPYSDHRQYCLFYSQGTCGKCMDRCPVGAITRQGKDKNRCVNHLRPGTSEYVKANFGFDGYGCGLCQTGVPCESKIPVKEDVSL